MPTKTFRGGVFLEEHKESTALKKIKPIAAPPELILPLRQHIGSPSVPIAQAGDAVKLGQPLAETQPPVGQACVRTQPASHYEPVAPSRAQS